MSRTNWAIKWLKHIFGSFPYNRISADIKMFPIFIHLFHATFFLFCFFLWNLEARTRHIKSKLCVLLTHSHCFSNGRFLEFSNGENSVVGSKLRGLIRLSKKSNADFPEYWLTLQYTVLAVYLNCAFLFYFPCSGGVLEAGFSYRRQFRAVTDLL